MKVARLYICLLLGIVIAIPGGALSAQNDYRTDLLNGISLCTGNNQTIAELSDGDYYGELKYAGKPLTVIIKNGVVEHIGYRLFTQSQRAGLGSVVCNFVERYLLETSLPDSLNRDLGRRLSEDDLHFTKGGMADLYRLMKDTSNALLVKNLNGRRYEIKWYNLMQDICAFDFPIDYNLLNGSDMIENERRLEDYLYNPVVAESVADSTKVERDCLLSTWQSNYFILPGKSYYTDELTSNRYYEKDLSGNYNLVYNSRYPQESLANLLTTAEIENNFSLSVKLVKYGGVSSRISVPLNSWIQYCISNGCEPYFGIISFDGNVADCEVIMRNEQMGYNHIMRVTFDLSMLESKEGTINARLNSYVPCGNVKFLFEELSK